MSTYEFVSDTHCHQQKELNISHHVIKSGLQTSRALAATVVFPAPQCLREKGYISVELYLYYENLQNFLFKQLTSGHTQYHFQRIKNQFSNRKRKNAR